MTSKLNAASCAVLCRCTSVAMMMRRKTASLMQRRWERKQKHHSSLLALLIALSSSFHYTSAVFAFTRRVSLFLIPRQNHQHVGQDDHSPPTTKKDYSVHLLSLGKSDRKKQVRQVWNWKDTVLGDGRDFFVPKPKTLTALNRYIVNKVEGVQECSAISNCARFELLLLVDNTKKIESQRQDFTSIEQAVSQCLLAQVESHASKQSIVNLLFSFDNPKEIDPQAYSKIDIDLEWTHLEGVECVTRHLSVVAAGMAERPNRPGRPVPFRPFSSRDAHILLQLKRTSEVSTHSVELSFLFTGLTTCLGGTRVAHCQGNSRCSSNGRKGSTGSKPGTGTGTIASIWIGKQPVLFGGTCLLVRSCRQGGNGTCYRASSRAMCRQLSSEGKSRCNCSTKRAGGTNGKNSRGS